MEALVIYLSSLFRLLNLHVHVHVLERTLKYFKCLDITLVCFTASTSGLKPGLRLNHVNLLNYQLILSQSVFK